ncbi:MAG TPA: hypothetical protein VGQ76_20340 [Thermoanaerobaculia bacterium]|jgi:hypothetical protein|nr:hypothetical protein [Thermoanaerobaculia bacterium]
MSTRHVALLVVCLVAFSGQAQVLEPQPLPVINIPEEGALAQDNVEPEERTLRMFQPAAKSGRQISAEADVTGNNGNLLLDTATAPSGAIMMRAFTATPNMYLKIGTGSTDSSFNVVNGSDLSIFRVRGDGNTSVRRDWDDITTFEINNANAGSLSAPAGKQLRFLSGSTPTAFLVSYGSATTSPAGGGNSLHLTNLMNAPTVFGTNGTERMRIHADGGLSVGMTDKIANARLSVFNTIDAATSIFGYSYTTIESTMVQNDWGVRGVVLNNIPSTGSFNEGAITGGQFEAYNVGPGALYAAIAGRFIAGNNTGTSGAVTDAYGLHTAVNKGNGTVATGYGLYVGAVDATADWGVFQSGSTDTNYFAGNVIIGGPSTVTVPANNVLYVKGESYFDGTVTGTNIRAHYQDVAEWVPSTTDLTPGTVVTLNTTRNNEVMASASSYDTTVAGVVSAQPGISLGIEGPGMEQVATTGRVKVRVDARDRAIRVGDLLVTSDIPGTAMRSEPMDINGRKFHQPGTIIGKALEPLEGGMGEILVLLSMQ